MKLERMKIYISSYGAGLWDKSLVRPSPSPRELQSLQAPLRVTSFKKLLRFWLNISVVHTIDMSAKTVDFKLHPHCGKLVLREAVGCWTVSQLGPQKSRVMLEEPQQATKRLLTSFTSLRPIVSV